MLKLINKVFFIAYLSLTTILRLLSYDYYLGTYYINLPPIDDFLSNTIITPSEGGYVTSSGGFIAWQEPENGLFEEAEMLITDGNGNGQWDDAEVLLTDGNGNGQWDGGETFNDANGNGTYDVGELFVDADLNGEYTPADTFVDADLDGAWDPADTYIDSNSNGQWDGDPWYDFQSYSDTIEMTATSNNGYNFSHWLVNGGVRNGTNIAGESKLLLGYSVEYADPMLHVVYQNPTNLIEAVFVENVSGSRELDSVEQRLVATGQYIDNGDGTVSPKSNLTIKYNHKGNNTFEIVEDPEPEPEPSFPSISDLIGKQIEIVEDGFYFTHPGKIYFKNQDLVDVGVEYKALIEDVNYVIFSENIFALGNVEPFSNPFVLNFNNDQSGTYKQYGDVSNIDEIPNLTPIGTGVFTIVENDPFVKTSDWEYSEFFDESLDLDRWGLTHRLTDDITVQNGDIGFAFSSEFFVGSDLFYLRLLPESKSWSVHLKDINISNNAGSLGLNLFNGIDYSYTMRIGSDGILRIYIDDEIGYDLLSLSAFKQLGTTQNIDFKISYDKDLNEIIFEYSEAGISYEVARFDRELAFLDLSDSNFSQDNLNVENYTPNNTSDSFSLFINVDSQRATNNNEITIGSIIINNEELTPQANLSDLFGKQLELKPKGRDSIKSHSIQMILNADGTSVSGIKDSIFENRSFTQVNDNSFIWWERRFELEYEDDGSYIFNVYSIPDANDGNQELVLDTSFYVTITDNSLQQYIDWEYQEFFDSDIIDEKWSISRRDIDDVSISQGNASFIFGAVDDIDQYDVETEMLYTRVIPETENWTARLEDINILNGGANVELFVTSNDRTLDTGLYLLKNNTIRINVFHYDDYSIYIEKGISDTRDLNFDISFDQNLQSIIYKYGKLDDLNEVARFNFDTGQLIVIDDGFNIEYEEGSPIPRNSTGAGFILGIDAEDVTKQSSIGDITIGSILISKTTNIEGTDPNALTSKEDFDGLTFAPNPLLDDDYENDPNSIIGFYDSSIYSRQNNGEWEVSKVLSYTYDPDTFTGTMYIDERGFYNIDGTDYFSNKSKYEIKFLGDDKIEFTFYYVLENGDEIRDNYSDGSPFVVDGILENTQFSLDSLPLDNTIIDYPALQQNGYDRDIWGTSHTEEDVSAEVNSLLSLNSGWEIEMEAINNNRLHLEMLGADYRTIGFGFINGYNKTSAFVFEIYTEGTNESDEIRKFFFDSSNLTSEKYLLKVIYEPNTYELFGYYKFLNEVDYNLAFVFNLENGKLDFMDGTEQYVSSWMNLSDDPKFIQPGLSSGEDVPFLQAQDEIYSFMASALVDSDGDGVPDSVDAFPNDPNEWLDTDSDGIGNNADTDDDNDLLLDVKESQLGSDPLIADNFESLIPIINQLDLLSSIQNLRPGSTMIEIHNGQATLTMEVEQSDDLGVWTNGSATSIQIPIDAEAGKKFFRFKMAE